MATDFCCSRYYRQHQPLMTGSVGLDLGANTCDPAEKMADDGAKLAVS